MKIILFIIYFIIAASYSFISFAAPSTNQNATGASRLSTNKHSYAQIEETPISSSQAETKAKLNSSCLYGTPGCWISIAPYLGIDSRALVLIPFYNQDAQILLQWQKLENISKIGPPPPLLEISGIFSLQPAANLVNDQLRDWVFNQNNAELDFSSHIRWITGFIDFTSNQTVNANQLASRPYVYLDRAFITVGDLNTLPLYLTLGKRFVPFGQYYSYMINGSIAQSLGKIKENSLLIGYQHPGDKGPYLSIFSFNTSKLMYGSTIGYTSTGTSYTADIGMDWIQNMVEAQALQSVLPNFRKTQMPGMDYHARIGIKNIYFITEYTQALHPFNPSALNYNFHGALPAAFNLEAAYEFTAFNNKPSSLAAGYGATKQSAALGLPAKRYTVTYNISPWKNIIMSVQYQHNVNYAQISSAGNFNSLPGPANNTIAGKLTFYF
ncbi:MAG: hypothetical protein K0R24_1811 [Gammaproteobacteria bacterium]|jgi:hypothetical protein|nr:hypothetical protein [Gammaproteobacteria bacterium]